MSWHRADATVTFSRLNKVDWEEGWHFVRVLAQTEDGDLIPLVDASGEPIAWTTDPDNVVPQPNESDLFYVLPEGDVDVEPPQRAVQREPSLVHALLRLRFTALLDNRDPSTVEPVSVAWAERKSRGTASTEMIEVKFGREGTLHLPVSRHLKAIEQKILSAPDGPLTWRLPIVLGAPQTCNGETIEWPAGTAVQHFLKARADYFDAVLNGKHQMISQGAQFGNVKDLVVQYASAYIRLLRELLQRAESGHEPMVQRALADLRAVLSLDSITLAIADHRGRRREAALIAPAHPLRALWLATWAALGEHWVERSKGTAPAFVAPAREALMQRLAPMNFPPILSTSSGRLFTAANNLHPFWTLYAPPREENPRGLVGDVCAAFGLPEPNIGGTAVDGSYLAVRVQRYLVQHPYITTLVINAFNAGRGSVLADMLLALQKEPAFAHIRYNLRLFVPDPDAPGVGEALGDLLSVSPNVTAKEADAFSTPTESHLRPKLRLAVRPTSEFRQAPDRHSAHLSLLFDVFPVEEVGAAQASIQEVVAPLHGLIQDFQVHYREDEATISWRRQPRHGQAFPLANAEELTDLLSTLPKLLSRAAATAATGQTGTGLRPVINLNLDAEERALLHQVHEVSDWVLTLDRNMGIEFFDHGGLSDRPDYLIDYSPDAMTDLGHRLVITSRSVSELESMLRPCWSSMDSAWTAARPSRSWTSFVHSPAVWRLSSFRHPRSGPRPWDLRSLVSTWSIKVSSPIRS